MRALALRLTTRLLAVAGVVLAVAALTFVMLHVLRPEAFPDPRPLHVELLDYLERVFLHYDFGISRGRQRRPVAELLNDGIEADVSLLVGGLAIGCLAGMAGGVLCAVRPRRPLTRLLEGAATFLLCAPTYWVGLMLVLLFGAGVGVVPLPLFETNVYRPLLEDPGAWLQALVVPWLVVAAPLAAMCLRMVRASAVEALEEEYLRTAAAKGLRERAVLRRHLVPGASPPVLTLTGVNMATMLTNVVLVEQVFGIPGVFRNVPGAMSNGDFELIQGMTIVGAVLIVGANLVVDMVHARIDPRVRTG